MSETVHYRGVLRLIASGLEDSINKANEIVKKNNFIVDDYYYDDNIEYLTDLGYADKQQYYFDFNSGNLYKVIKAEECDLEESFAKANIIGKDEISFDVRYYNGGVGFSEMLGEALSTIKQP